MQVKSKFRKLFWVRIAIGFFVFLIVLFYVILVLLHNIIHREVLFKNPFLLVAFIFLTFLIYAALDLFEIFRLTVTETGIEKTLIISGRKQTIPFKSIISVKKQRIRMRTKSGDLTDGYSVSVLKLENNKSLIISPDNFENYKDIMLAIRNKLN
jgi:hypothetical protein